MNRRDFIGGSALFAAAGLVRAAAASTAEEAAKAAVAADADAAAREVESARLVARTGCSIPDAWRPKTFRGREFFLMVNWWSWAIFGKEPPPDCPVYGECARHVIGRPARSPRTYRDVGGRRLAEKTPPGKIMDKPYTLRDFFPKSGPDSADDVYSLRDLDRPILLDLGGTRWPFFLDEEYPLADRKDYAAWRKAHPNMLGSMAMDEYDQEQFRYAQGFHAFDPELARRQRRLCPVPENGADENPCEYQDRWIPDLVARCSGYLFGERSLWSLSSGHPSFAMQLAAAGTNPGYEATGWTGSSLWTLGAAYTRGAARMFGRPWWWYSANNARLAARDGRMVAGENNYRLKTSEGWGGCIRGKNMGLSTQLTAWCNMYGFLAGAMFVEPEHFHANHSREVAPGQFVPTREAYDFNRLNELAKRMDRGVAYTPLAMVFPSSNRMSINGLPERHRYEEFSTGAAVHALVPGRDARKEGIEGGFWNSPIGELWDVVCPDIQGEDEAAATLGAYAAAVMLGRFHRKIGPAALRRYVESGGTLFVSSAQIMEGAVDASLAGVAFGADAAEIPSAASFRDELGRTVELGESYVWLKGEAGTASPLWTDANGGTVAFVNRVGRGKVVTLTARGMVPACIASPHDRRAEAAFIKKFTKICNGEIGLGLMKYVFGRIQGDLAPVKVDGDVQFGMNRTKTGWLVWMFNNKGMKHFSGEEPETDRSAASRVELAFTRISPHSVRDAETGEAIPFGETASVTVAPGEWKLVSVICRGF